MDMNDLMMQAQQMQLELARAQEEVNDMTFSATAGGGMVTATALGNGTIESIEINPDAVDPNDIEMLQDMIVAAVNSALRGISEAGEQRMAAVTGGLNLSGLF